MLAIAYAPSDQESLPACLPPWRENSLKPVSQFEMLRFIAHHFVAIADTLGQMRMDIRSGQMPSERSFRSVAVQIDLLRKHCKELDLRLTLLHLDRIDAVLRPGGGMMELLEWIRQVQQRVGDELSQRIYIQIDTARAQYYEPTEPPFGQGVFDAFPSANRDIAEASNCLALERNTAAVFHLMRVIEAGLKALAAEIGVPYAPSWESYLRQLKTLIESDWSSKPADIRAKQPLYKELLGDIQAIKIAWRNPTMHIVSAFDGPDALRIFEAAKAFMVTLASAGVRE